MHQFSTIVAQGMDIGQSEALERKNPELTPAHLLFGLIKNPASFCAQQLANFFGDLQQELAHLPVVKGSLSLTQLRASDQLATWLTHAASHAAQAGKEEIREVDLLRFLPQFFPHLKIDYQQFDHLQEQGENAKMAKKPPEFLLNLNELAKAGKLDPVIGRAKEIRAVMEILGRRNKNNPVLVGPAGVGKTAIVEGLANAIVKGEVPDMLQDKTVYSLEMGSLVAGTKFRGEFEERITQLLKFVRAQDGEVIIFIDELHQLVGAGRTDGAMDAANLLKPALARGELHCIGATTPDEYQKYILGDSALDRRFRDVRVDAPSREDAIEIMMGIREKLEAHHGIKISDSAIFSSVFLSEQYITNRNLPDKAIDLIDEAAAALKLSAESMPASLLELAADIRSKKIYLQVEKNNPDLLEEINQLQAQFDQEKAIFDQKVLALKEASNFKNQLDRYQFELDQAERSQNYELAGKIKYFLIPEIEQKMAAMNHQWVLQEQDVAAIIQRQTKIPVEKILQSRQDHILALEKYLNDRVYGQGPSIHEISQTLITSHAGLSDETRPLGSFLLQGPSGVGKTETAKVIAEFLFNGPEQLVRLDMSEYMEKHAVAKLIGAPAGYVGYEEGGILTEAIRRKPYCVILFDEVEKAHRDFTNILLQILDDGRLTDNKGRVINFKNTIIIMTTNSQSLEQDFRPELLGRMDAILTYQNLDPTIMRQLIDKEISLLNERLKRQKIHLKIDEATYQQLITRGYDPLYGARPLASVFRKYVTTVMARKILAGEILAGEFLFQWSVVDMQQGLS